MAQATSMLTQYDVEQALAHYDLGAMRSVRSAAHGLVNETAFVETNLGRFVVRRNQRRLGQASLVLRQRLLAFLRSRGFPAPRPIATRAGATAVAVDGRFFEVFAFIEGDEFNPDRPAHLHATGAILARYHRIITAFTDPPPPQEPRYVPGGLHGLTERLMQRDLMGDLTEMLSWYDLRATELRRALPDAAYAALPHVLIHGDIHRDNILFRGDVVAALLDFDQVTIDARLVDLADALVGLAPGEPPEGWSPWGVYPGPLDPQRAQQLISGYQTQATLSTAERTALLVLVETIWLQGNLRRVLVTGDAEPDYHLEVLEQGRWLSRWIQANAGSLR
jgi:homoserine kinase type II